MLDTNNKPRVSVVVPLYNHERYIVDCLESVKACGYPNLELIVIDDGSDDNSYNLAAQWKDRNQDIFEKFTLETKPNEGIVKTLNYAIEKSSGEFVAPLASDDCLLKDSIQIRLLCMEQNPGCRAVIGDCIVISDSGDKIHDSAISSLFNGNRSALSDEQFIVTELILRWSVPGPALLAESSVFDPIRGVGPYREGLGTEDRDFYLRLLGKDLLRFVNKPVAAYRAHSENYSLNRSVKTAQDFILSETEGANRFRGFQKYILKMRTIYYHFKMKRRNREPFWVTFFLGELSLWLVSFILARAFSLYVWTAHRIHDISKKLRRVVLGTLNYLVENDSVWGRVYLNFFQILSKESRDVELLPMRWLDQQTPDESATLRESYLETYCGPRCISNKKEESTLRIPSVYYRTFESARVSITSSSVVTNDGVALVERIPIEDTENKIFDYSSYSIISHGKSHALTLSRKPTHISQGIFLGGNGSHNYFHWMVEILPKLEFLAKLPSKYSDFPLLVSEDTVNIPAFSESLNIFAGKISLIILGKNEIYCVDKLVYISSPATIPFNLRKDAPYEAKFSFLSSKSVQYVRDIALNQHHDSAHQINFLPKKIFLCRKKGNRNYNQEEVEECLGQRGFEKVYMEDYSFRQQVELVSNADYIAGPTGAAWTNLIFCRPGTKCLCWMAKELEGFSAFSTIANFVQVDLLYIQYISNSKSTSELSTKDYLIDLALIRSGIDRLESL